MRGATGALATSPAGLEASTAARSVLVTKAAPPPTADATATAAAAAILSARAVFAVPAPALNEVEAAPTMAAMAREAGPDGLRWQALREALALDTAEGFRALCHVARASDDPLAMPAGALRAQLVEAHPELLALEKQPCRA